MKTGVYNDILRTINSTDYLHYQCIYLLIQKYPNVKDGTLSSILSNRVQKLTKTKLHKAQEAAAEIFDKYSLTAKFWAPHGIIKRLADEYQVPSSLIANIILIKHIEMKGEYSIPGDLYLILSSPSQEAKHFLRDTTYIQDTTLAYEVFLCTIYDFHYSPTAEIIRMNLGQKYEIKLYKKLDKLGIVYQTEEDLRKLGFDKTPDAKLEIPVAINGFIIHWIESKARFADVEIHKEYHKTQYESYWNRFGPGLIIYWFGFLDELQDRNEKHYIISDHVPENIFKLF